MLVTNGVEDGVKHTALLASPDLDLDTPPWPSVSRHAKDLVRRMLQVRRQDGNTWFALHA